MSARRTGALLISLQFSIVANAAAQAWVPAKGEGNVTITYQNYYATGHFNVEGRKNKNGATHAKTIVTELDYGITDTVGLIVSLPFVSSKYTGPPMYLVGGHETTPGPLDDRTYHGAWQDIRVELRRAFWAGPVAFAPFIGGSVPTNDYETHGEAVAGRNRAELLLGASAGIDLDRFVPRTYAHVRYALANAAKEDGFPSVKSNIDLETGHGITSRIAVRGLFNWQIAHQGPTIAEMAEHDWLGHDRFVVSSYLNLGAGASFPLTRSAEIYTLWIATVSGKGGAHVGRMFAVGTTWSFGGNWGGFGPAASLSPSAPAARD